MPFNLDLIERALDCAQTYEVETCEGAELVNAGIAEFAKLRKAMEEAPRVEVAPEMRPFRMERIATMVRVEVSPSTSRQRVLLVKADD